MPRLFPRLCQAFVIVALPSVASAQLWEDVTDSTIGKTAEWTNNVEVAAAGVTLVKCPGHSLVARNVLSIGRKNRCSAKLAMHIALLQEPSPFWGGAKGTVHERFSECCAFGL